MKILKLRLQGKSAFFKKPDVNTYFYFTYGHIHKVAILGILGAIMGYKGYNQMKKEDEYPEFYEKLKRLNIGIVPLNEKGIINKKINVFNNSVGYASKEKGGNLIIKEHWLENPKWEIYFLLDCKEAEVLSEKLINKQFIYIPYLGKNDHFADLEEIEILEGNVVENPNKIDSLFKRESYKIAIEKKKKFSFDFSEDESTYKYEEKLPIGLELETNQYILEDLIFTNKNVEVQKDNLTYNVKDKVIEFI